MKTRIGVLLFLFAFAFSFTSCEKDDEVTPDLTGSTYEIYKRDATLLGITESDDFTSASEGYFQWHFAEGGKLEDGNGLEYGTWTQNGGSGTVVTFGDLIDGIDGITYTLKISGDEITAEYNFFLDFKDYFRKI